MQHTGRTAYVKMTVQGGTLGVLTAYAPHNDKPPEEKFKFYEDLGDVFNKCSVNGQRLILGDLNARLGQRRPGEEEVIGGHTWGREAQKKVEPPNRDLLMQFCFESGLAVANTYEQGVPEEKATFVESGAAHLSEITDKTHAMLDLVLVESDFLPDVTAVRSHREAGLQTNHFLVSCSIQCKIERCHEPRQKKKDRSALKSPAVARQFTSTFAQNMKGTQENESVEEGWASMVGAFRASEAAVPDLATSGRRPWISQCTLDLIDQRSLARLEGDSAKQKDLHRQVRRSAKADKTKWLSDCIKSGSWDDLQIVRKQRRPTQSSLRNASGVLTASDEKADTMAEYLESVHWRVRPADVLDAPALGPKLQVDEGAFTESEVKSVISSLRNNRAAGGDDIPAEFWKALTRSRECLEQITEYMSRCWLKKETPRDWHKALVSAIYKKGRPDLPENYRPICLLSLGYKIYASLVKNRLLEAGADRRLSTHQFGFRQGRSTQDAICILRRRIEAEWAAKHGHAYILALDWKQAFDSVNTEAMLTALERFGLPDHIRGVISNMYTGRTFEVKDAGSLSKEHEQKSGVSQGCPLSPLLFIMVLTVVMKDAEDALGQPEATRVGQLVYADDTLLMARTAEDMHKWLQAVQVAAGRVGLELHWGKLQLLRIRCDGDVKTPAGDIIEAAESLSYLGTTISNDGRVGGELTRRLGAAFSAFSNLRKVWGHTSIGEARKLQLFNATVVPKLLYSLSTVCLNAAERRRLDGAHCRMLRRLCGVSHPMVSHVSNDAIRQRTGQAPLSNCLLRHQLLMFGKVARAHTGDPLRDSVFTPGTWQHLTDRYVRKCGRPRLEWSKYLHPHVVRAAGEGRRWEHLIQDEHIWREHVNAAFAP